MQEVLVYEIPLNVENHHHHTESKFVNEMIAELNSKIWDVQNHS